MRSPRSLHMASTAVALGMVGALPVGAAAAGSTAQVSKSTVQTQAARILAAKTGQKPPTVSCPSGVAAKVGAIIHCTVVPHGSTLQYPATVTVRSITGSTAHFYVQVGQARGQANEAKFCSDNATINAALSAATTPKAFLAAVVSNERTILDLQSTAPSKVVNAAGTLVEAAREAVQTRSIAIFNTNAVSNASLKIDKLCKL